MTHTPENQRLELYLTRTFSVLGTSLWEYWYRSPIFQELTGFAFEEGKLFGTPAVGGESKQEYLVRCFRAPGDLARMKQVLIDMTEKDPATVLDMLKNAVGIYETEVRMLDEQPSDENQAKELLRFEYQSLEEVIDAYVSIGIFTALLPYFWLGVTDPEKTEHHAEIQELCERLRSTTLYPFFFARVVLPYFEVRTGVPRERLNYFTFEEILALYQSENPREVFEEAFLKRKESFVGKDFLYTVSGGVCSLVFLSREEALLQIQEIDPSSGGQTAGGGEGKKTVLKGVVVSKGDGKPVTGIARVVTGTDISNVEFNEGDILVTINSSPVYLPLILKAGALLSEEGGMACHTAVVAREFRKIGITAVSNICNQVINGQSVVINPLIGEIHI